MMSIKPFYTPDDLPIMDLDQIYMTSSAWYATGFRDTWATFDVLVRDMPSHRNFLVFTGLEEVIRGIMAWRYKPWHIRVLRDYNVISSAFARYLLQFRFTGSVHAMREGTIFFPGEPVVRITAPIIEANLLTAFLITSVSSNTLYASKFIRSVLAAKGVSVIGTAPNRASAFEAAFKSSRSCFIVGSNGIPLSVQAKLGIRSAPAATIAYHAFISSYPSEIEAMRAAARHTQVNFCVMVDTYNIREGLKNAITIAPEIAAKGLRFSVVIDSGNLLADARLARRMLDQAGLSKAHIILASNLDEYKITRLVKAGAPANTFIVNTEAVTSSDAPKLEVVYKLAEIIRGKNIEPKMKLSLGKMSLPGRKQVFRIMRRGHSVRDIIGLDGEKRLGTPLLRPMIVRGKQVYHLPKVTQIRSYVQQQLTHLPPRFKEVLREHRYLVTLSPKLRRLIQIVRKNHLAQYDL